MNNLDERILKTVWSRMHYCSECEHCFTEDGEGDFYFRRFCLADRAVQCPGARSYVEALLSEFDPDEADYLAQQNKPSWLFTLGYVWKFGGTYAEAKARAEYFKQISNLWSLL